MSFVNQANASKHHVMMHGLMFTFGVLISFWTLAGIFIVLRQGGSAIGWGFQMQNPEVVIALSIIFLLLAINMLGTFEIGSSAIGVGNQLTQKQGFTGTFFSGILASIAATPCSAPFLGTALGATLSLPPLHAIFIFSAIAIGLSTPYLLLSAFPNAVKYLPRPGAWMESLKQGLSFLLFATVVYLIWVVSAQVNAERFRDVLFGLVAISAASWVFGRWIQFQSGTAKRIATFAAAILLIGGFYLSYRPHPEFWQKWSPEEVTELRSANRPIFVDFTARWCATCQLNKERVFGSGKVQAAFEKKGIVPLKADWTNRDPAITHALETLKKTAVPVNLLYLPGTPDPIILPEILSEETVLKALEALPDKK